MARLNKVNIKFLLPLVGILASLAVLVARAAWMDNVSPSTVISSADWNQMAIELQDLDNRIVLLENKMPGTQCGLWMRTSAGDQVVNCGTVSPFDGCPSGYTRVGGMVGTNNNNPNRRGLYTCVKN